MAAASAGLEKLRKAINSVRPDEPDVAASFSAEDFQILLDAGIESVGDFQDAGADTLRELGLDEARVTDLILGGSTPAVTLLLALELCLPPKSSFRHDAGVLAVLRMAVYVRFAALRAGIPWEAAARSAPACNVFWPAHCYTLSWRTLQYSSHNSRGVAWLGGRSESASWK